MTRLNTLTPSELSLYNMFACDRLGATLRPLTAAGRRKPMTIKSGPSAGSFPISDAASLTKAIKAYGRAKDRKAAKAHIINSAYKLGLSSLLPEKWKKEALSTLANSLVLEFNSDVDAPESPDAVSDSGVRFCISLLLPEGVSSGDGRTFAQNSVTSRNLPLPLMWQQQGGEGHDGSVVVGRIDSIERVEGGIGNAYGVFDTGPIALEVVRLVRSGMLRGVSADLDEFEASVTEPEDPSTVTSQKMLVQKARLMGATLVAKPAFQECTIELIGEDPSEQEYEESDPAMQAAALVAAGAPLKPPASWFENPKLGKPTHLTVDDDGRVYGHIAAWDVDHIGLPFGTRAPRSASGYRYFTTGVVKTAEGTDARVGQLTLAGGHAPLRATAEQAVKHYDDTSSAWADVSAGEDQFGIWVAGSLRPQVTPEQVRVARASSPSGDWRPIKGSLELVAVCSVNVPGFPVVRARVASGMVQALVAAGAAALAELRVTPVEEHLMERLAVLEARESQRLVAEAAAARARVAPALEARTAALTAAAKAARTRVRGYDQEEVALAAKEVRERVRKSALR